MEESQFTFELTTDCATVVFKEVTEGRVVAVVSMRDLASEWMARRRPVIRQRTEITLEPEPPARPAGTR